MYNNGGNRYLELQGRGGVNVGDEYPKYRQLGDLKVLRVACPVVQSECKGEARTEEDLVGRGGSRVG